MKRRDWETILILMIFTMLFLMLLFYEWQRIV